MLFGSLIHFLIQQMILDDLLHWSQTKASTVARPGTYCVKSARYRTLEVVGTVHNRRPQASFKGDSYSLPPASCFHMDSILSDFPVCQEKLTFIGNLSIWEKCLERVEF